MRLGRKITELEFKRTSQTQHKFCHSNIFYLSSTTLTCKPYKCVEVSFWNRGVFKTVTVSSVETQVPAEAGGTADTQALIFQQ